MNFLESGQQKCDYILNAEDQELSILEGLSVANIKFINGCFVGFAVEGGKEDIYFIYRDGYYWSTEIMSGDSEKSKSVMKRCFYRDEYYAVFGFVSSMFTIYDIENDCAVDIVRPEYVDRYFKISSDPDLAVCGDYLILMNMEGDDGKNYYAVLTKDGQDYISPTICDYALVTERGNLVVVCDGVTEEILLENREMSEIQTSGDLAMTAQEVEKDIEPFYIDRKANVYVDSIIYNDIFYLDGAPPYNRGDTYYLGGNYESFAGIWYYPADTPENGNAFARILGDGKVLYESSVLDAKNCREDFLIDVKGIQELSIEYQGDSKLNDVVIGLSDMKFIPMGYSGFEEDFMESSMSETTVVSPINLFDLYAYQGELSVSRIISDNMGNEHTNAFVGYSRVYSAVYDIGGKYTTLLGTVAVTKTNQDNDYARDKRGYLKIYGDDVLLWEDSSISSSTKPYEMSVDISGVTDLRIEICGFSVNLMYDCLAVIFDDVVLC